jgi:LPPG:FO 2-phospho-L-lactate transferase
MTDVITALAGGVGAARLLTGLVKILKGEDLSIIVNTGDDIEMHGLHVSPDLDIVTYTLAGIADETKGWGIDGDTFRFNDALKKIGGESWFSLGDRDLATHVYRTALLRQGKRLSEVTAALTRAFGVSARILPMTDDLFETRIVTERGTVHFQEYLVKRQAQDRVLGVEYAGADNAKAAPGVLEALEKANLVVVCPSNPIVSIGTILSVAGVREALRRSKAKKVAVSPIVAGAAIKGPAAQLLRGVGLDVSAYSVARLYSDFLDVFVIDVADFGEKEKIEKLGVDVEATNSIMRTLEDKVNLAKVVLKAQSHTR